MSLPSTPADSAQKLAAHPHHSVWVAASAGSGKTKVLTDRVLNLLLEGCDPERILCLTFTKAAAAEMANRLRLRLGEWAIASETELKASLLSLQSTAPTPDKLKRARTLFALTLDTPGGLKIQTIHSFCQSLLKRFPLEAGISPFFTVMDDRETTKLIQQAFHAVIPNPAFSELVLRFGESTFEDLNTFILQKRDTFKGIIPSSPPSPLPPLSPLVPPELSAFIPLLQGGSPTDKARGDALKAFLSLPSEAQKSRYKDYTLLFLTQQGDKRARLITQKLATEYPALKDFLEAEATRLEMWVEKEKTYEVMHVSHLLTQYAHAFLGAYETLKTDHSLLDYEDLIVKSVELLKNPGCHWVLYKLDGGLDHILLDEAQDTSPSQWQVIRAIGEEFYANALTDLRMRTLFIVGDSKQSIYSFQGADPAVFTEMQKDLRTFAKTAEQSWEDVDLNVSFRSTPEILHLVNQVFPEFPHHLPFRKESPGHVEIWPLMIKEPETPLDSWNFPLAHASNESPQKRLAFKIATTIKEWVRGRGPLARPINPGDILILVRRRTAFVDLMIRALKDQGIPVAGVDRLWLLSGLGIQDLLRLGDFLLFPQDDLALATLLKGPLFTIGEDDLFALSYKRGDCSLWERLQKTPSFHGITTLLKDLIEKAQNYTPFALYSYVLGPLEGRKKWQSCLGTDVLDSLDEFLNLCLVFQEKQTPSLQGFIQWISEENIELKRDLEQSNQIRVMTVHGSKGLQAPIVFLPDTTQAPLDLPPIGFYEDSLLWLPPSEKDIFLTKKIKQTLREKQAEEYWRLLYVALTRAEDALYVCGWEGTSQENWYSRVATTMQKIGTQREETWVLSSCTSKDPLGSVSSPSEAPHFLLPPWLKNNPSFESPRRLLTPSSSDFDYEVASSYAGDFGRIRGILTHKLLEILPSLPPLNRTKTALAFLERKGVDAQESRAILDKVEKVFATYPDLFSGHSQGEVPVMGHFGDKLLSGQIDRLIVDEDTILIIDFKTQETVPPNLDAIPKAYLYQMALYFRALQEIYPQKSITCALLWTHIPRLDLLPPSRLDPFRLDNPEEELYLKEKTS